MEKQISKTTLQAFQMSPSAKKGPKKSWLAPGV